MAKSECFNILMNIVKSSMIIFTALLLLVPVSVNAGEHDAFSQDRDVLLASLSPIKPNTNTNTTQTPQERGLKCKGYLVGTRWCDNKNGTVTDLSTGLVWLKSASWGWAYPFWADSIKGVSAFDRAAQVKSGNPKALTDNSEAGDWRLPTINELKRLTSGAEAVSSSNMRAFIHVQPDWYWSGTSYAPGTDSAWNVGMHFGDVNKSNKSYNYLVWPVRGRND